MKSVIYLFTFYMLTLSLIPCGDGGGGIVEIAKHFFGIEHQHVSDHTQHSQGCGDDSCSPFCACSCCSIPISISTGIEFYDRHIILISKKLPFYKSNFYPSRFDLSIWQPPRFS